MQGAHNNSHFGETMATLDFNHDGYDDLVVCSPGWRNVFPSGWIMGKVDIYFGGPNFDNIPEITMEGQYDFQYNSVINIGDVNGDGYDDLYIGGYEPTGNPTTHYLRIYTGGNIAPPEPDIMIPYTLPTNRNLMDVVRLGDVNGDNKDDVGFSLESSITPGALDFYIVWGGGIINQYFISSCAWSESYTTGFNGIGDINGDGYNDFTIGYTYDDPYLGYHLITIYYGNADSSLTDTMVLAQTQANISKISTALGDINGDGIDDFMGYLSDAGLNVWLGSAETNTTPNLALNPSWQGGEFGRCLKYGDLNHDGFDDVAGTNFYIDQFRIWMGRSYPNGNSDLLVYAPYDLNEDIDNFGYGLTMGDYNGDSCCDVAVSAPFTDDPVAQDYRGYVYVYAGNTDLADTTTSIIDPHSPPITDQFKISISPNPVNISNQYITIKLENDAISDKNPIEISIYNIRGQCVQHIRSENYSNFYNIDITKMASGIYLCQVKKGNKVDTGKISVIK
ncbi:MAG TPA: FG-GAP-like repeat-containing protein [Candidatus Cloacimonadota bacterium]|nr:FG-GAP-like repeat-containing protein [Candidatus Cloacimonadota bacterium]